MPDIGEPLLEELTHTTVFTFTIGFDVAVGNKMEHLGSLSSRVPTTIITQNESFSEVLDSFRDEWADWLLIECEKRFVPAHACYVYGNIMKYKPDGSKPYEKQFRLWMLGIDEIKSEYIMRYGEEQYDSVIAFREDQKSKGCYI